MSRAIALITVLVVVVIAVAVYGMTRHATSDTKCTTDSDCPGQICIASACVPTPGGCATSADCSIGQVCTAGACVTTPTGGGCNVTTDCDAGKVCISGACVVPTPCGATADCPSGMACRNGTCNAPNCVVRNAPGGNRAYILTNDALPGKSYRLGRRPVPGQPTYNGDIVLYAPTTGADAKQQQLYLEPANGGFFLYTLDNTNAKWYVVRNRLTHDDPADDTENHLGTVPLAQRASYGALAVWVYTASGQLMPADKSMFLTALRCSAGDSVACTYGAAVGKNDIAGPFLALAADFACETPANTWTFTAVA